MTEVETRSCPAKLRHPELVSGSLAVRRLQPDWVYDHQFTI